MGTFSNIDEAGNYFINDRFAMENGMRPESLEPSLPACKGKMSQGTCPRDSLQACKGS